MRRIFKTISCKCHLSNEILLTPLLCKLRKCITIDRTFNSSSGEVGLFRCNWPSTMTADDLARRVPSTPGPWFKLKMTSYQYRKSHCGDKTILRPSYLHNGISDTVKITSIYWIGDQVLYTSTTSPISMFINDQMIDWISLFCHYWQVQACNKTVMRYKCIHKSRPYK